MLRMIAEGRYEFRSPEWDEVSAAAKDLVGHKTFAGLYNGVFQIKKLLVVDAKQRYTAKQALAHPFLVLAGAVRAQDSMFL